MTFDDFSVVIVMIYDLICVKWISVFGYNLSILELFVGCAVLSTIIYMVVGILD